MFARALVVPIPVPVVVLVPVPVLIVVLVPILIVVLLISAYVVSRCVLESTKESHEQVN